uniref:DUF4200 domain-containing protein n=1 Tax=Leptobrachium leishanense TaxID=445787 RepID=A0A8C5Q6K2_9ANUR
MSVNQSTSSSRNPFVCPDEDVLPLLRKRVKKLEETASASRGRSHSSSPKPLRLEKDTNPNKAKQKYQVNIRGDPITKTTPGTRFNLERQMMRELESKNKEFYLAQFVMQDTVKDLKAALINEEQKLKDAEKKHEEEALSFEELRKAAEKRARKDTIYAKGMDLLKAEMELEGVKRDIERYKETLREYRTLEDILKCLPPVKWWECQNLETPSGKDASIKPGVTKTAALPHISDTGSRVREPENARELKPFPKLKSLISESRKLEKRSFKSSLDKNRQQHSESEEEPEMYFTDPKQLYDILEHLQRRNQSLSLTAEEFSRDLQEIRRKFLHVQEVKCRKIEELKKEVKLLTDACVREEENTNHLRWRAQKLSFEESENAIRRQLKTKIKEVYKSCISDIPSSVDNMLAHLESYFDELLKNLEAFSEDELEAARKKVIRGKILRAHEEWHKNEKLKQKECQLRAMQSTTEKPKKVGRKLMIRSNQSHMKKKTDTERQLSKAQKEEQYFCT